ncbi:MAG: ATP-grasp domain-containing protein [Pirellulales bacterium]
MATSRRPDGHDLIAVGASVRAFACSAARAGWTVHAADLFGDADLRAVAATTVSVGNCGPRPYPQSLVAAAAALPAAPWCYTGALENHPDIIAAIAEQRPLLGTSAAAASAVRDHARLADVLQSAGIAFPDTFTTPTHVPRDGSFLVKPRASAGGRGIAVWDHDAHAREHDAHVWQRRIVGESWAAAFVVSRAGAARLWGVSRQLVGCDWCHTSSFAYCGSLDLPLPLVPPHIRTALDRIGNAVATTFAPLGLVGLIGIDLVVDPSGHVHVIEVNPRPTASMELVERTSGESLAGVHLAACGGNVPALPAACPSTTIWGKAVLFASHDIVIDAARLASLQRACLPITADETAWPVLADIPCVGTAIPAAAPLLTVFAAAADHPRVLDRLRHRAAAIDAVISASEPPRH